MSAAIVAPCLPPDLQDVDPMFNFSSKELDFKLHVDHAFRHAKELQTSTHGGYNQGYLDLPPGNTDQLVQLCTVPSSKSEQTVQPNMLHITIMNKATRNALWKLELCHEHWKLQFKVRGEQAFLLNADGSEMGAPVNPLNVIQTMEDGRRRFLFGGENGLLMTIITPLQSVSRSQGIRITDVFADRLSNDELAAGETKSIQELAAAFTSKKVNKFAKIELHRVRIRADIKDQLTGELLGSAVSGDINNTKNNDVGAINLLEMSDPRSSCTEGGFKVLLSSEFRAPTLKGKDPPVRVLFVIERNGKVLPAEQIYQDFKQISLEHFQIYQNSTLAFIVPSQNVNCIRRVQRSGDMIQVALFRPHDGMFSAKKFRFDYIEHASGECHFCAIMGRPSGGQTNCVKQLERKKRARKDERVRRTTVNKDTDSSSFSMFSPPPTVSSSSGVSSQEEFSPASKVQRLSDSESSPEFTIQQHPITMDDVPLTVTSANPEFTLATQEELAMTMIFQEPTPTAAEGDFTTLNNIDISMGGQEAIFDINTLLDSVNDGQQPAPDSKASKEEQQQPQFSGFDKLQFSCSDDEDDEQDKSNSDCGQCDCDGFMGTKDGACKAVPSKEAEQEEAAFNGFAKLVIEDESDVVSDGSKTSAVEPAKKYFVDKGTDVDGLCQQMDGVAIDDKKSQKKKKGLFRSLAKVLGLSKR